MMRRASLFLASLALGAGLAAAQQPPRHWSDAIEIRSAPSQPVLAYTLRVDPTNLDAFAVEIRIRNAPDTLRLAMAAHPEYDDRFWRFVEGLAAEGTRGPATVAREDSALWRVVAPGGATLVRYRVRVPKEDAPRAAWRPFLTPTGGLVGGIHAFLYVVGASLAPAHVTLQLPPGWEIATGLEPTADPAVFFAPSAYVLLESPMLVGALRTWRFQVDGVPHRVVYWPAPDAAPFDTLALVTGVHAIAREAIALFGRAPYREYAFLLQDAAGGALEHANSVTIGAPSTSLAEGLTGTFAEAAHEYFHAWNLVRIRPAEYGDVDYRTPPRSRGLWWSEGITMYYADLLLRRSRLPVYDSTRVAHLQSLITRYLGSPGNARFAPESVSVVTYGVAPGALGDYGASVHLQGELIATLLDFLVRDATGGRRSLDDVLRLMLERFSGERGFTSPDVERTVADVCGCDVHAFFERHVRAGNPFDFDRYLALAGLRARVTWGPAVGSDGQPYVDLRVSVWTPPGDSLPALLIGNPQSAWGRAGLHSGDRLVSLNGAPIADWAAFRAARNRLRLGDTVRVQVARAGGAEVKTIVVTGYDRPFVTIEEIPAATERQRALRAGWVEGKP